MYKKGFSSHHDFWGQPTPDYSNVFGISNHSNVDDIFKISLYRLPSSLINFSLLDFSLEGVLIYVCPLIIYHLYLEAKFVVSFCNKQVLVGQQVFSETNQ